MPGNDLTTWGHRLARALRGVWRPDQPLVRLSPDGLRLVAPGLLAHGAAGLLWPRLRVEPGPRPPELHLLAREHRQTVLRAVSWEQQAQRVTAFLRRQGVEPILVKGWSAARHYAVPQLRPYGDIDVCLPPRRATAVRTALIANPVLSQHLDLHDGIPDLHGRTWDEAVRRSQVVPLDGEALRVLGPEDHLRLVSLHLVRHCLARPLGLCDLAAALEAAPPDFDWDYCLHGPRWLAGWVLCAVGLAERLVGARVPDATIRARAARYAGWVPRYVLWVWGEPVAAEKLGWRPAEVLRQLAYRKVNPVRWAWRLGLGPSTPLSVIHAASCLARPWQAVARAREGLRREPRPHDVHFETHRRRAC